MKTKMPFARIPIVVLDDSELAAMDISIYAAIASYSSTGSAFPGIETIAKRAHTSRMRTIKGIKNLEARGHLTVQRGRRDRNRKKPNIYFLPGLLDSTSAVHTDFVRTQNNDFDSTPDVLEQEEKYNKTSIINGELVEVVKYPSTEDSLYEKIKVSFETISGPFADYGREGAAIKRIIKLAGENEETIRKMLETFLKLTKSRKKFWSEQPFLPSVLSSGGIWPRIKLEMEKSVPDSSWIDKFEKSEARV